MDNEEFDLDALVEEAVEGTGFAEDYVTSSKKDGELVPKGKHDVFVGYVGEYGVTDWGVESVSIALKMDDTKRSWWVNLDFACEGDADRTDKSVKATVRKLLAIGFTQDETKEMVRRRAEIDWSQILDGLRLKVNVKHAESKGHTYANTYFNKRNSEEEAERLASVDSAPAPAGEGTPLPSNLPVLGSG